MENFNDSSVIRIGVISDTHGLFRPEIPHVLKGTRQILHAGDIGSPDILETLEKIAPVTAVRGNTDPVRMLSLPETDVVRIGPLSLYILHDLHQMDLDPVAAGFQVVISGHTHQPRITTKDGVLYLNPGSAGPRRFNYPISAAILKIPPGKPPEARIIHITPS